MSRRHVRKSLRHTAEVAAFVSALTCSNAFAQSAPATSTTPSTDARARDRDEVSTLSARLDALIGVSGGLRADDVARRARETSFDVRARSSELEAAAALVDQSFIACFPRLGLSASYTRFSPITAPNLGTLIATNGPPGVVQPGQTLIGFPFTFPVLLNAEMLRAQLTVPITDLFLRGLPLHDGARHAERAAQLQKRATERRVEFDGKQAYFAWTRARLQSVVAGQALVAMREHLEETQRLARAGTVPEADISRVEAQVASAELLSTRATHLEEMLADRLRTALHDNAHPSYEIGETLESALPDLADDPNPFVDSALHARPELEALAANLDASDAQLSAARAGYWPRVDAFGEAQYSDPNQRYIPPVDHMYATWAVGAEVVWSPNDAVSTSYSSSAARARRDAIESQLGQLRDGIRGEVVTAWEAVRDAKTALDTTQRALHAAETNWQTRRDLYRYGRATGLEVLDAETELTRSRMEMLAARVDAEVARARWQFVLGQ